MNEIDMLMQPPPHDRSLALDFPHFQLSLWG